MSVTIEQEYRTSPMHPETNTLDEIKMNPPANAKTKTAQHIPPDGGWGWCVVFASFILHVVVDGFTYGWGVIHDELVKQLDNDVGTISLINSIMVGVTLCSGPIASLLVNAYGCRVVTIVGAVMASVFIALSTIWSNIYVLFLTIGFGTGFGLGLMYLPAIVIVIYYFDKYRSLATGIAVCGSGVGTGLFAYVFQYLVGDYGWQKTLLVAAAVVLTCIFVGLTFKPVKNQTQFTTEDFEMYVSVISPLSIEKTNPESRKVSKLSSLKEEVGLSILKDHAYSFFAVCNFVINIGFYVPYLHIVGQAKEVGISQKDASELLIIIGVTNVLGRIILGYFADRPWANRFAMYNVCIAVSGLTVFFSAWCNSYTTFCIYAGIFGLTGGAYVGLTSVILTDIVGLEKINNAFGLLLLFQGLASFFGTPLVGVLYDYFQTYNYGMYLAGSAIAISGSALFAVPYLQRKNTDT